VYCDNQPLHLSREIRIFKVKISRRGEVIANVLLMKLPILLVVVAFLGCGRAQSTTSSPAFPKEGNPTKSSAVLALLFSERKTVTLLSHNGVWGGTDNDVELVLRDDGTALITDYGYVVTNQKAKYELTDNGMLTVTPDGDNPWLPMQTTFDGGKLVVSRPSKSDAKQAVADAGIDPDQVTDDVMNEAFDQWPLRQVSPK
jgi:hypothetical protein